MMAAAIVALTTLAWASADPAEEAWDVVANMAASLAEPNPVAFMQPIAKSFENRDRFAREITTLCQTNEITSSVSPLGNTGDDKQRTLQLDWYLQIQSQADGGRSIQRRQTLTIQLARNGKHWQVLSISPVNFFDRPPVQ